MWASKLGLPVCRPLVELPIDIVNDALCARIQRMIADKLPASHGARLLAGMMDRYAKLRGRLAASWDAQRVWERHVSKSVHVRLDVNVCNAMVTLCLPWRWPVTASLLRASFLGYTKCSYRLLALAARHQRSVVSLSRSAYPKRACGGRFVGYTWTALCGTPPAYDTPVPWWLPGFVVCGGLVRFALHASLVTAT
jgi:hypothetical protein